MPIEFHCPNGHRLSAPEERAGRVGKCPKCGAGIQVPATQETLEHDSNSDVSLAQTEGATDEDTAKAGGESSKKIPALSAEEDATENADRIVFLCPNGHKLNCPPSMQGRPGKCPHCNARFLVPERESVEEEHGFLDNFSGAQVVAPAEEAVGEFQSPAAAVGEQLQQHSDGLFDASSLAPESDGAGVLFGVSTDHAMATLVGKLWQQRGEHGVIELYLKGGQMVSPDWYAATLSSENYGMFAVQDEDGNYTVTAVTWDSIERVALRGISTLPEGVFD